MRQSAKGIFTPLTYIAAPSYALDIEDGTQYPSSETEVTINPGAGTQWTPGSTCIISPDIQGPGAHQKWTLQSISFSSLLAFGDFSNVTPTPEGAPIFGKLGKIIAGLIIDDSRISTKQFGLVNFPDDLTLTVTLWDPANDPLPPDNGTVSYSGSSFLPISSALVPSTPIELTPGIVQPSLGIWMLPSLLGNQNTVTLAGQLTPGQWCRGLGVYNTRYTINYDDGQ